jgi:hypothetical protein
MFALLLFIHKTMLFHEILHISHARKKITAKMMQRYSQSSRLLSTLLLLFGAILEMESHEVLRNL